VLAHEALHCALSHFARRQHRLKHRWDLACDLAVNPLLVNDGLKPCPDTLYDPRYENMTAEEIYPSIEDLDDRETHDQHIYDEDEQQQNDSGQQEQTGQGGDGGDKQDQQQDSNNGGGDKPRDEQSNSQGNANQAEIDENLGGAAQPPPLSESEKEDLSVQWQQRLAGAAQQAMQSGKMGEAMMRLVDHLLQPQLPWRMLLARYMTAVARDDYSFQRPSRREGPAILPSLRSAQLDLTVVVDTSGSITDAEDKDVGSEIDAIKATIQARIHVSARVGE